MPYVFRCPGARDLQLAAGSAGKGIKVLDDTGSDMALLSEQDIIQIRERANDLRVPFWDYCAFHSVDRMMVLPT
jgi:hypothetical protein